MARNTPYVYLPLTELVLVFACLLFIIGSALFLKGPFTTVRSRWGNALFIVGSIIFLAKSVHSMWHSHEEHGSELLEERHTCAEYFENAFYALACIIFGIGCVFFWPGLCETDYATERAEIAAAWCFIVGSMGFVIASFFNAVLLSRGKLFKKIPAGYGKIVYNVAFVALLNSQVGGVLFVTGSIMFLPGFRNHCNIPEEVRGHFRSFAERLAASPEIGLSEDRLLEFVPGLGICDDIIEQGAICYIVGSVFYTVQALLYLAMALMKQHANTVDDDSEEMDTWREDSRMSLSSSGSQEILDG